MKAHSNDFKNGIAQIGKQITSKITYTINGTTTELGDEQLNSVTPHYKGAILKSVMKQLDIDSNEDIPVGTIINYQFGLLINEQYEYLDYGNYIVKESKKQEDVNSYLITCYDKMLYSMVDYEDLNITYPITIRNYINAICTKLGLTFANLNNTFANYNRQIQSELYLDNGNNKLGYTFRDVLDELAEVTASTICINNNDELEIRYITNANDTIDENYFKDINVNFKEKYGPINSIVLSRSAETDNVVLKDDSSIAQNGLCEIKIIDNQIMNWNDRSDYLADIFSKLAGLEYYINDYASYGILYYDLCDKYTTHIGDNYYTCVMLNDEVVIQQGLEENVHTDMPLQSETDYTKSDSTDRKINQTYLIVDKQNGTISSVVSSVGEQDNKISQLTQTVDELQSEIQNVSGMVMTRDSMTGQVTFTDTTNTSEVIALDVYPITTSISYLYPSDNLYPSDTLYMTNRIIRFYNNTTSESFYYTLPDDLLYYDSTHYDSFHFDLNTETCQVTKKCKYNADGSVALLSSETTNTYTLPHIELTEGVYSVSIYGYSSGYISATLMAKNIYTDQFYTKVETNSIIDQKADEITLGVNQTLSNYSTTNEMNSAINVKANEITSSVSENYATKATTNTLSSRISQTAKSINLSVNNGSTSSGLTITTTKEDGTTSTTTGTIQMNGLVKFTDLSTSGSTTINGSNITTGTISASRLDLSNYLTVGTASSTYASKSSLSAGTTTISGGCITTGTITADKIASNSITTNKLATNSVTADKIQAGAITADKVSSDIITTNNLSAQTISASKISGGTLDVDVIQVKSLNGAKLMDSSITATQIANTTITNSKIADGTITSAKISSLSANKITTGTLNGNNVSVTNLSASNIKSGSLTSTSVKIGSWSINGTGITSSNAHIYPDYLGYKYSGSWTSCNWEGIGRAGTAYSDKRLKKDIKSLDDRYNNFFDNLKPISFKWKASKNKTDNNEHIGFIAQDIKQAQQDNELDLGIVYETDNLLNLDKRELIALNTWQIQKLKQENKELKNAIDELRKQIQKLKEEK